MKKVEITVIFAALVFSLVAFGADEQQFRVQVTSDADRHGIGDYVQDGLVAMFDGIFNAGVGLDHSPDTTVWKELSGCSSDGSLDFRQGGWQEGTYFRSGPVGKPNYGQTAYFEYSLPQSFIDHYNQGGGFTLDGLYHFIENSNGPGSLFFLDNANKLSADASGLLYRGIKVGLDQTFGALSRAVTNTVTTLFDGKDTFSQYRHAVLLKSFVNLQAARSEALVTKTTVGVFSNGKGQWGSSVDAYAIRVYNRALTPKEILQNVRVDDERYFGSNLTYVVSVVGEYGSPCPANGLNRVAPGSGFTLADTVVPLDAGSRMVVTGWEWAPDHGAKVSGSDSTPEISVRDDGDFAWQWKRQYAFAVSAGAGGGVSAVDAWQDEGTVVSITATPQPGYRFLGWSGTVGEQENPLATTIAVPADRTRTVKANFGLSGHAPTTATFAKTGESGTYSWNDPETWGGSLPGEGDTVVIEGTSAEKPTIVIDGPMPTFGSVLVRHATVVFTGWNNALRATGNVTLAADGKMTHANATTDVMAEQSRVWIVCGSLDIIENGASIDVSYRGWPGEAGAVAKVPPGVEGTHSGPCGGTYGGLAGVGAKGFSTIAPYGDVRHPRDLGMAGSTLVATQQPGAGGGAVLIEATGQVNVSGGGIVANGKGAAGTTNLDCGGGSGGSIEISCSTIIGSATVEASGGSGLFWGGAGAGGRIAIHCRAADQEMLGTTALTFLAHPGSGWNRGLCYGGTEASAEHGTLYLSSPSLLNETVNVAAQVYLPTPAFSASHLEIPNQRRLEFPQDGFRLTVDGDVTLDGASGLVLGGEVLQCFSDSSTVAPRGSRRIGGVLPVQAKIGGNLSMAGAWSEVVLYPISSGAALDDNGRPAGAVLEVEGALTMQSGARLYPVSCGTNGISCAIRARDFDLQAGAMVDANTRGYFGGCGNDCVRLPGQTVLGYTGAEWCPLAYTDGASHGGLAGGLSDERALYGDARHPVLPGAGSNVPNQDGKTGTGGHGGGLIHLEVSRMTTLNGTLQAHGSTATGNNSACAAAGGGIYLRTSRLFVGSEAAISAKGCNSSGAPNAGGGGRIAIWRKSDMAGSVDADTLVNSICTVAGGKGIAGHEGQPGTIFLGWTTGRGLQIIIR